MVLDAHNERKYGAIVFGVPAFLPLVLYFVFLFDFDSSAINFYFYENIEIFKRVLSVKNSSEELVWGYLFSIVYLIFMLPLMVVRSRRVIFLGEGRKNKTKLIWFLLSGLLFFIFLFLNFVDYSSVSQKYLNAIELSFYFWPLFYFYFLFPLYLSLVLVLAFFNTEIR